MKIKGKSKLIGIILSLILMIPLGMKEVKASPVNVVAVVDTYHTSVIDVASNTWKHTAYVHISYDYTCSGTVQLEFTSDNSIWVDGVSVVNLSGKVVSIDSTQNGVQRITFGWFSQKEVWIMFEWYYNKGLQDNGYFSLRKVNAVDGPYFSGIDYDLYFHSYNIQNNTLDMVELLQDIHDYLISGSDNTASAVSAHLTDNIVIDGNTSSTWEVLLHYTELSKFNNGFKVVNGGLQCQKDGYIMAWAKIYAQPYVSSQVRVGANFTKNRQGISMTYSYMNFTGFNTLPIMAVIPVKKGDIIGISCNHNSSSKVTINFATTIMAEYVVSSDTEQVMNSLNNILVELQRSYVQEQALHTELILKLDELFQNINIDIPDREEVNNTLNVYNTNIDLVNNITKDYNTTLKNHRENVDLMPVIIPEDFRESVNLYHHIFDGLAGMDYIKMLITLAFIIGIVIVGIR